MTTTEVILDRVYEKKTENLLFEIFGGNPYHAQARTTKGDIYYTPVEVPLDINLLEAHLNGEVTLGSYQLLQGSNVVKWLGWDVDSEDLKVAREQAEKIISHLSNIPYCIEFSGRKGYHILIFLKEPMPASDAMRVTQWVRDIEGLKSTGVSHVECYPKQDKLTLDRPKGSLLKIPLGEHPRTHARSKFIDVNNGWENGPALDPLEILAYRADIDDVLTIIDVGPAVETQLVDLISDYWIDGKRHDLSLYLCGFLVNEGWGSEQVKDLVQSLVDKTGDPEAYNRLQTVKTTFERAAENRTIRGRQGLAEILPVSVMQKLTELVSSLRAPDTVGQIDDIRYTKGKPKLESARLASNTIWSILNDSGNRIFQTAQNVAYWYNAETHLTLEEGTEMWDSLLNKDFGLNPHDPFSKLVAKELRLRIVRDAAIVPIETTTFWSDAKKKLYVNLGGPEVYIVSGDNDIEESYNGECGIMFKTNPFIKHIKPDFNAHPENVWDHLVNDVSFTTSSEAPANPEEQKELLKAWILAFFFQELMPTKPILAIIGQAGSGKTSAIRRILQILEGPDSDVLGIPTDKQDAFRTSIEGHRVLVLDNLEKSGAWWMVDILNKLSTGTHIEIRKLYRTNVPHVIIPKCFVAITAVNVPFSDETLFSRLLVLETQRLEDPLPEHILQKRIRQFGPAIWADLLLKLGKVVELLKTDPQVRPPTKSRLVDFTVFCEKIKKCPSDVIQGEELSLGLTSMIDSQLRQLKESSQAIYLLEEWISLKPEEASSWKSFTQIFEVLQTMAQARNVGFQWKNAGGLQRHLLTLEHRLKMDFGAEFDKDFSPANRKEVIKIRFKNAVVR